jgi:CDP-diacylglycerol--glycerol-3-phosphate 3-phosphatidyltransferase
MIELRSVKERIPWLMAAARAVLGPVVILGERARWNGLTLATLVIAALLSDIFDGVLARRWKCDTAAVRLFDSMADIVFYACCAVALWMRHPGLVRSLAMPILAVAGLEASCLAVAFVKFGKLPSYHSYVAKIWGLVLASALVAAFVTKHPVGWLVAALALGVLSNLEGLAMSLIMPVWRQDVKTLAEAWRLRGIAQRGKSRFIPKIAGSSRRLICSSCPSASRAEVR